MTNSLELQIEQNTVNEKEAMPVRTTWQVFQRVLNVITHALTSIVTIYMTCLTYNAGNSAISWHAFLCTIGVSAMQILHPKTHRFFLILNK